MPRKPTGQILEHTARNGVVSYGVRFRGRGYPAEVIHLGRSDEGMNRARAEHEARLIVSQILAGTWSPPLKADYVESEAPTIAQLADEHYHRKVRKGLRPNSLADMKRKLEIHLLPHFGDIPVSELTSRDVEAYLDRKLAENRRIKAALAIGEPLIDGRRRALQPLRPQTINSHLHLLSEILARAVREGLLARNPAEGEDLRLEVRRERKYGLELDEAMSLVDAAGRLDQRPAPSDELRRRIVGMRATARHGRRLPPNSTSPNRPPSTTPSAPPTDPCRATAPSLPPSRSRDCASASFVRSTASTSTSLVASYACSTPRRRRECAALTSTTISRKNSPRTRLRVVLHGSRVNRRF